ncbi:hypothetical protein D9619_010613 [Psilocybe cf. subviscida]|uniref:Uncharacterized protein n=1 Tax=Psilocybe cf. subviscida TaxID=2480587 RepID=A0A8H5B9P0_9AGAR|nr:hypothetical protein D9619_010613 [Psilocybe cf. subviscida]
MNVIFVKIWPLSLLLTPTCTAPFQAYGVTSNPKDPARLKYALRLIVLKRFQVTASPSCPPLTASSAKPSLQPTLKQQHLCDLSSACGNLPLSSPSSVAVTALTTSISTSRWASRSLRYIYPPNVGTFLKLEVLVPSVDEDRESNFCITGLDGLAPGRFALPPVVRLEFVSASSSLPGLTQLVQHLKCHVGTFVSGELKGTTSRSHHIVPAIDIDIGASAPT